MKDQERNPLNEQEQNRAAEGQNADQKDSNLTGTEDKIKHVGSQSNAAPTSGHADLHSRPSEGLIGSKHSSGISTKRSVTGSDFDGQVSPS